MNTIFRAAGLIALLLSFIPTVQTLASGDLPFRVWSTPAALMQDGPSCVGFALETWERSGPNPIHDAFLSGDEIYKKAQEIDGIEGPHDGTTINAGIKVLQDAGIIKSFTYSSDVDEIRDFVLKHGPVVLISQWHHDMAVEPPDGYAIPVGPVIGWHAYECNDWVSEGVDGQSFGCINTWGPSWNPARAGHFRIHLNDAEQLLREGAYAALLTK